jgi:hypothetical protein
MNGRKRRYERWPCEIEPADVTEIRRLADSVGTTYAEMTRRLLRHSFSCSRFNPKRAYEAPQPPEVQP